MAKDGWSAKDGRGLGDWIMWRRVLWEAERLGEGQTLAAVGGEGLVMAGEPWWRGW